MTRQFDYGALNESLWDGGILLQLTRIHEYKGRQEVYLTTKPVGLERLVEIAKVQSTTSSNEIEGISAPEERIKALLEEKTAPRNRDEAEIAGYRDVLARIHDSYEHIPLSSNVIQQLHRDLYRYSGRDIGGRFKDSQNYIKGYTPDGKSYTRFTPLEAWETPEAVETICEEYRRAVDSAAVDALLLIPVFIADFLCIHPFNDGNGRMSRLLTVLLLYQSGYLIGRYISLELIIEQTKETYYDVLAEISKGWHEGQNDYKPFISYLLGVIVKAYRQCEERLNLIMEVSRPPVTPDSRKPEITLPKGISELWEIRINALSELRETQLNALSKLRENHPNALLELLESESQAMRMLSELWETHSNALSKLRGVPGLWESKAKRRILSALERNPGGLTKAQIMEECPEISDNEISRTLNKLRRKGLVKKVKKGNRNRYFRA